MRSTQHATHINWIYAIHCVTVGLPLLPVRTQVLAIVGCNGRISGASTECGVRPRGYDQARLVHVSPCEPKVDDMPGPCLSK